MEQIKIWLSQQGYRYQELGDSLKVKLGGLSHEIQIVKDYPKDELVVVTAEVRKALGYGLMLFAGLGGIEPNVDWLPPLLVAGSVVGFIAVVLTEIKVQQIKQEILQVNHLKARS